MQAEAAVFVVVRVGTGRTHRVQKPVDQPEQRKSCNQPHASAQPAAAFGDFRKNPEQRDAHQQSSAEGQDAPRDGWNFGQPDARERSQPA